MRQALGDHIFTEYVRLKREEWASYNEQVHDWEIRPVHGSVLSPGRAQTRGG